MSGITSIEAARNVASPGTNVTCSGSLTSCSGSNVNLGTFPNGLGNYHSPGDLSISSNESDLDTLWNTSGQKAKQWENNRIRHRRFAEASDPEASAVAKIIGNEFQSCRLYISPRRLNQTEQMFVVAHAHANASNRVSGTLFGRRALSPI